MQNTLLWEIRKPGGAATVAVSYVPRPSELTGIGSPRSCHKARRGGRLAGLFSLLWLLSERNHWMTGMLLPLAGVCHDGFQIVVEFRRVLFARFAHLFNNFIFHHRAIIPLILRECK